MLNITYSRTICAQTSPFIATCSIFVGLFAANSLDRVSALFVPFGASGDMIVLRSKLLMLDATLNIVQLSAVDANAVLVCSKEVSVIIVASIYDFVRTLPCRNCIFSINSLWTLIFGPPLPLLDAAPDEFGRVAVSCVNPWLLKSELVNLID